MGSQFVDFNADGHLDYVSATFDGSPHVAYGSDKGFATPVRLMDANGKRILISSIWNYEAKKHENLGHAMPDGTPRSERCISALAFDWDADGDFDLLLGSYESGRLYRRMNEGTNKAPKFAAKNIPVQAGGKDFAISGKMTAPRLVDWDGDGDMDLIAGSFGDSWNQGAGGAVYVSINTGSAGKPTFGTLTPVIEVSRKGQAGPTRPDAGLYVDAVDYDNDGDLDLVVGGYSMWKPKARVLNDDEKAMVSKLQAEQQEAIKRRNELMKQINEQTATNAKGLDRKSEEYRKIASKSFEAHRPAYNKINKEVARVVKEIGELIPGPQRRSFVWLYERK